MRLDSGAGEAEDIARASEEAHGLGLFVRSLVGLDREAAIQAFAGVMADTTFTANRLHFVNLIIEALTQNGVMPVARLDESPFTDHAATGHDMIFTESQVDGIVTILDEVWEHAMADTGAVA